MRTAIGHGLIVPKPKPNGESMAALRRRWQKGKRLIFRYLTVVYVATQMIPETSA